MNPEDPVVRSARREALAALVVWFLAMSYTVAYCYLFGYQQDAADIRLIYGVPDWVLWGVIAPWTACTVLAALFAFFLGDADLGAELPDSQDELFSGEADGG